MTRARPRLRCLLFIPVLALILWPGAILPARAAGEGEPCAKAASQAARLSCLRSRIVREEEALEVLFEGILDGFSADSTLAKSLRRTWRHQLTMSHYHWQRFMSRDCAILAYEKGRAQDTGIINATCRLKRILERHADLKRRYPGGPPASR